MSTLCNIDDDQLLICLLFQRHNSGLYSFNHISIANLGMYAHARVNKQNGGPGSHGSDPVNSVIVWSPEEETILINFNRGRENVLL